MNFKPPRDPNTPCGQWKLRDIAPDERLYCQVGSGECSELAVEAHDADGAGTEFRICAKHLVEFHALEKLIAEMTPNQIASFDSAIKKHESNS